MFRRYESLTHPFAAVRAVLSGEARAENHRTEQGFDLVDIVVDVGSLTMAVDPASGLPRWIRWPMPHQNLGRAVATTTFIGYERWDGGLQLPMGWRTHIDWRDTLIVTRFVDGYFIDGEHAPDIAAAPDVLAAPLPRELVPLAEGGSFEFVPVEGRLRLQDAAMTLDIYEVVRNNHMADAVFAYAPASRTLIEADLATPANEFSFWAEAYEDNIEHYALDVDRVSPNHALPMTHEETLEWIRLGVPRALARCEASAEAGRPLPGCPAFIFRDWESASPRSRRGRARRLGRRDVRASQRAQRKIRLAK